MPSLPPEIYHLILMSLVDEWNIGDDLDERVSPFHGELPVCSSGRSILASVCLVSQDFYVMTVPILWRYLVIRKPHDLRLLCRLSERGPLRPTRRSLPEYTRRIDFMYWRDRDLETVTRLLTNMRELRTLIMDNYIIDGAVWCRDHSESFLKSLPITCPFLRRLQFLSITETPTLSQVAALSSSCKALRTLQIVSLNSADPIHPNPMDDEALQPGIQEDNGHGRDGSLLLEFQALEVLSIGDGDSHIQVPYAKTAVSLLDALRYRPTSAPKLRHLDVYIPFELIQGILEPFQLRIRSTVTHLIADQIVPSCSGYRNLSRLVLVVHISASELSIPTGLDSLQVLEFVTDRGPASPGYRNERILWNEWMLDLMEGVLQTILVTNYPSLSKAVLWKRRRGNRILVEKLARKFTQLFQSQGIVLETRTHHQPEWWTESMEFLVEGSYV